MDAIKKSILGYQISDSRNVGHCILAMRMAFSKFKEFPGKTLKFAADGYTAYKLAQQQFMLQNMDFNLIQVIGLTNDDPISSEYRWLKQIIERLNRTFKFSYQITNDYGSEEGSNTHFQGAFLSTVFCPVFHTLLLLENRLKTHDFNYG